jgi:hypothetical protein
MTATTEPTAVTLSRKIVGTLYEGTSKVDLSLFSDHGLKYHNRFILDPTSKGTGCTTLLPGSRDAKMPPKFALFNLTADESRMFGDPSAPPDESEWTVQKVTCDEDLQAFRRPGPSEDFEFMEPDGGPEGGDTDRPGEPGTILTQWTFERTTVGEDGELIDTDELPQEAPAEFRNTVPEDGELIDTDELSQEARAELRNTVPVPEDGEPIDTDEQPQEARPELRPAGHCWGSWRISL